MNSEVEKIFEMAEEELNKPLTNREFLLGCAHIGRMIYDVGFIIANNGESDHDPTIGKEVFECLKNIMTGDYVKDLRERKTNEE
jgi:hypothetical protein